MATRRYRFSPPRTATSRSFLSRRVALTTPLAGIDRARPRHALSPNAASHIENFRVLDEGLVVRSAVSRIGASGNMTGGGIYVQHMTQGGPLLVMISGTSLEYTASVAEPFTPSWSSGGRPMPDITSTSTSVATHRYDSAEIYNASTGKRELYLTCTDQMVPHSLALDGASSHTTHADYIRSGESYAFAVAAFDDRINYFGSVDTTGVVHPTRLRWTNRGLPSQVTAGDGGFDDLNAMRGEAARAIPDGSRLLLFSSREVWEAVPRRDAYVYDTHPLFPQVGCGAPRAAINTPYGVFFYGSDERLYRIVGPQLFRVGRRIQPYIRDDLSASSSIARKAFMTYNPLDTELLLWYETATDPAAQGRGVQRALVLRPDTLGDTGAGEQDGIWTTYSIPLTASGTSAYASGTNFVDSAGRNHALVGAKIVTAGGAEVQEWTTVNTLDVWGTTPSRTNITADYHLPIVQPERDPVQTEMLQGAWLHAHNAVGSFATVQGRLSLGTAIRSHTGGSAITLSTFTLDSGETGSGAEAAALVDWIPFTSPTFQEGALTLSVTSGRPAISRLDILARSYTGRYIG